MNSEIRIKITEAAKNIEIDALCSFKAHFNAASRWRATYYLTGIAVVIVSSVAGTFTFSGAGHTVQTTAGILSVIAAILAGIVTFLNPMAQADAHRAAGSDFQCVRNLARLLHEVKVLSAYSETDLISQLEALQQKQAGLGAKHPVVPHWAYQRAKDGVDSGEASYLSSQSATKKNT